MAGLCFCNVPARETATKLQHQKGPLLPLSAASSNQSRVASAKLLAEEGNAQIMPTKEPVSLVQKERATSTTSVSCRTEAQLGSTGNCKRHVCFEPPQQDNKSDILSTSTESEGSSAYVARMKQQRTATKQMIQEFVRSMVKGRQIHVMNGAGQICIVFMSLNRELDSFKIKMSRNEKQGRHVSLGSIDEVLVGTDIGHSEACEGLETPLDDLSVTLSLNTQECITFRMADIEARDTLAMSFMMLSENARRDMG